MTVKVCNSMARLLSEKTRLMLNHAAHFLVIIFLLSGCTCSPKQSLQVELSPEEKQWMAKFFYDLLFEEGAVYTLWGSKPVTEIVLYHYTVDEMDSIMNAAPEEELENCYVRDDYDLPANWEKWEKIEARIPVRKYMIFRSHFDDDGKASFVYFVDVLKAATLIQSEYDLFRKAVGFDFNPLEVVLEMRNRESVFWMKVSESGENMLLWGLLFGYGKWNSCAFHWKYANGPKSCNEFMASFPFKFSNPSPRGQVHISMKNFLLPSFVSFSADDRMISLYEEERQKIQNVYRGKDPVQVTLQKLTAG